MSGGPVFNDLDEVIGVVAFARIYTAPADTTQPSSRRTTRATP